MTTGGWIIMVVSIGSVIVLFSACLAKVLRKPSATEHMHSQADIDTHDQDT